MFFTPDETEAFGDWLECMSIRHALLEARPDLATDVLLHPHRPMLRILRSPGDLVIVRMRETETSPWVVGTMAGTSPVLHELASCDAVTALVIKLLGEE